MEHSNNIPDLINDFKYSYYLYDGKEPISLTFREKLLVLMIQNLNERILELEKLQLMKPDGKDQ